MPSVEEAVIDFGMLHRQETAPARARVQMMARNDEGAAAERGGGSVATRQRLEGPGGPYVALSRNLTFLKKKVKGLSSECVWETR